MVGGPFPLWIVELDRVSKKERDGLVGMFGTRRVRDRDVFQWCYENVMQLRQKASPADLVGFNEMVSRFLDVLTPAQRLAGLAPEQRLAGLTPEQVLPWFAPEQVLPRFAPEQLVLALPDDLLRGLDATALAQLPDSVQSEIRKRLGR